MSKRRRILIALAAILLAAYLTGPQVNVDYPYLADVRLTNPSVQLFHAGSGTVTGFNTFGHFNDAGKFDRFDEACARAATPCPTLPPWR
jgi:hypothetical protein